MEPITAAQYRLSKIFSADYDFVIPPYQRPYAWTRDQAGELFDDLHRFHMESCGDSDSVIPYFLGSVVLIKDEHPIAQVVDGQQRLTTLTILLSAIASRLDVNSPSRGDIEKYVRERGDQIEKLDPKPRLALRERDREFFANSVQKFDFHHLENQKANNDAQKNIQANSKLFLELLDKEFPIAIESRDFVSTIMTKCYLVVVSTPTRKSAVRIFTVLNTRGLDLLPTDIIKAEIIDKVPGNRQDEYSEKWEGLEEKVGREGFHDLFGHIRMIHVKEKPRRALLDDFKEHVLQNLTVNLTGFIDEQLTSYTDAYYIAKNARYDNASETAKDVNRPLRWLNRNDNSDWLPSAIFFLSQEKNDLQYAKWFFQKLERLAAFLHVCAKNVNQRIVRYAEVISAMENSHSMTSPIRAIELRDEEKKEMKRVLNGNIYEMPSRRRNYIILRLDSFVADAGAEYDRSQLTVEHVLPQTVNAGSEWAQWWPNEEDREQWMHRIANLVPLNRNRNSAASNYCFQRKKEEYFDRGTTPYALTGQVVNKKEWTPKVVNARQDELLRLFADKWELN